MNSRAKGKRGELEVAHLYQTAGYPEAHRAGQMQAGVEGYADVIVPELPWLHIEAKRQERWSWDWLDQTVRDACQDRTGVRVPTLHFRRNKCDWWVALPASHWLLALPAISERFRAELPSNGD